MSSEEVTEKGGWLARMRSGLSRSSEKLAQNLTFLVGGGRIEAEDLDQIEEAYELFSSQRDGVLKIAITP